MGTGGECDALLVLQGVDPGRDFDPYGAEMCRGTAGDVHSTEGGPSRSDTITLSRPSWTLSDDLPSVSLITARPLQPQPA